MKPQDPQRPAEPAPARWLIIDGYSLLYRDTELASVRETSFNLARELLLRKVERIGRVQAERITVVFDGRQEGNREKVPGRVEVIYSPAHQTADTVIERLVHHSPAPERITVVTSDRAERETITAAGAFAMSCAAFLDEQKQDQLDARSRIKSTSQLGKPRLGDFFPKLET